MMLSSISSLVVDVKTLTLDLFENNEEIKDDISSVIEKSCETSYGKFLYLLWKNEDCIIKNLSIENFFDIIIDKSFNKKINVENSVRAIIGVFDFSKEQFGLDFDSHDFDDYFLETFIGDEYGVYDSSKNPSKLYDESIKYVLKKNKGKIMTKKFNIMGKFLLTKYIYRLYNEPI